MNSSCHQDKMRVCDEMGAECSMSYILKMRAHAYATNGNGTTTFFNANDIQCGRNVSKGHDRMRNIPNSSLLLPSVLLEARQFEKYEHYPIHTGNIRTNGVKLARANKYYLTSSKEKMARSCLV